MHLALNTGLRTPLRTFVEERIILRYITFKVTGRPFEDHWHTQVKLEMAVKYPMYV